MTGRLLFHALQLRERLWFRPIFYCLCAILVVFVARAADMFEHDLRVPLVSVDTIEKLLTIISSTMLAVATFAVGSMVAAYSSVSASATPRAFALVVADDVSQASLSRFIGAFIFSIVAIIAVKTDLYLPMGQFVLFCITILIFAWVVTTFVRWVDNIARLGRVGDTIEKVESAAMDMFAAHREAPFLGGRKSDPDAQLPGEAVVGSQIGYLRYVDMAKLQEIAKEHDSWIELNVLPGSFMGPGRMLCRVNHPAGTVNDELSTKIADAFVVGRNRTFREDPRFAVVVLSEIAARALSPAVNDPGTAITIVGSIVRLLSHWDIESDAATPEVEFDRILVPELDLSGLFNDAFTAIARDGADKVEVCLRLQSAFRALATHGSDAVKVEAVRHAELAWQRCEQALTLTDDRERVAHHVRELGIRANSGQTETV